MSELVLNLIKFQMSIELPPREVLGRARFDEHGRLHFNDFAKLVYNEKRGETSFMDGP